MAITQILPRILEQSLLNNFIFNLNGKDKLVRFLYTNWDSKNLNLPAIKDKMSKSVSIIIEGKEVKVVNSIEKLLPILGIKSRNIVMRYMNHTKGFYSTTYKEFVNIRYPHIKNLLNHEIIFRKNKKLPELIIPNISLSSLQLNILHVYNENLSLVHTYKSIREAVRYLNSNYKKLGISLIGRKIAISRAKNKMVLVFNEIGSFYFGENPNSDKWKGYQKGKYPLILRDITINLDKSFDSMKLVQKYLLELLGKKVDSRTIIGHLNNGTIYRKKYLFISRK